MPQDAIALLDASRESWQTQLSQGVKTPSQLLKLLELPTDLLADAQYGHDEFPVRVPMSFVKRIKKGDVNDPLLRQVLPLFNETQATPEGFVLDPLGEADANKTPGIVHKYEGRVLLIASGSCAINCRYCFRRHFPYADNQLSTQEWLGALDYIRQRPDINEVILSGGDPLNNNDQRLFTLINAIEAIPHISRLRIHTRLPIVLPDRITDKLINRLKASRLNVVTVVHANHANEINHEVGIALSKLHGGNLHVLNQSVLLKGINDTAHSLKTLSECLFTYRVMPYYLHLLDAVKGAHHFDVPQAQAQAIMQELQATLPGFLVPKLVKEVHGCPSKTPINTEFES